MSLTDVNGMPFGIKYNAGSFVRATRNPPVLPTTEKVFDTRIAHVTVALGTVPAELTITEIRPFSHAQEIEQEG